MGKYTGDAGKDIQAGFCIIAIVFVVVSGIWLIGSAIVGHPLF
jgi:hypothetical protein